ncbi:MAG TPA: DegQ family serine endoprotease [Nitrospiraceae bacterium]|nr:DegQ family serine endoprotease [Nitrospiraceae bacterium]
MGSLVRRSKSMSVVGVIAGLTMLSSVSFLSGQYLGTPQGAVAATPVLAATTPSGTEVAPGYPEVAKMVRPGVVNITPAKTLVKDRDRNDRRGGRSPMDQMEEFFGFEFPRKPFGPRGKGPSEHGPFERGPRGGGMGSGVIISADGYIITNNHVVDGVKEVEVTLPDKREFKGKVVGTDPKTDLAVVKIEGKDLPSVNWGDSSKLQVGEYVLAVGNPFGLNSTVTLGIVSALGRGRMGITQYEDFIQTDAAINPGNSGGALVNTKGELVGINTAIFSQSGGYQGVGFAVPTSMAKPVYESLMKSGKVVRGYMGVGIQDLTPDLAKTFGLKDTNGVLISDVTADSPAEESGIKQGDVILEYQGERVDDPAALQRMVTRTPVGTKAALKVYRDGHEKELTVKIGEQPDTIKTAKAERGGEGEAEHALVGIEVQTLDRSTAHELGLNEKTKGVVVTSVEPDSPAEQAGIRDGDVILEVNRHEVRSVKDFEKTTADLKKDQNVLLRINRRGAALYLNVKV